MICFTRVSSSTRVLFPDHLLVRLERVISVNFVHFNTHRKFFCERTLLKRRCCVPKKALVQLHRLKNLAQPTLVLLKFNYKQKILVGNFKIHYFQRMLMCKSVRVINRVLHMMVTLPV